MTELTSGGRAGQGIGAAFVAELPAGTVEAVPVRALLLGERLDTRALERDKPLGVAPLTVEIPGGGDAVLFRYGAVVLFGPPSAALDDFVAGLRPLVTAALPVPERDDARLLIQQKMVGRVETGEKPELLWDHPELERFYVRLAEEYELRDRDRALDRKLDVISRTVETLLGLVQTRSSLRVEWYIVLLIVAELLLSTYPLLLGR